MATRGTFLPSASIPAATNGAPFLIDAMRREYVRFDATTQQTCYWSNIAPQGLTGALTAVISGYMASATAGGVIFGVALEAVTAADALVLFAAESFASDNENGDMTVPATAGHPFQISITLTNNDSLAVADYYRLRLRRDPDDANDDASGYCHVLGVELRDAA